MAEKQVLLACGVFRHEYSRLPADLRDRFETVFLDSMLHMDPERLDRAIEQHLGATERPVVLLFGDCSPRMNEYAGRPETVRIEGANCAALCLGSERYKKLIREGCFFFMPEWTNRWKEVFDAELGLGDPDLAKEVMAETEMRDLVYVDTGTIPPPTEALEAASAHLGIPWRIERSTGAALERALRSALEKTR